MWRKCDCFRGVQVEVLLLYVLVVNFAVVLEKCNRAVVRRKSRSGVCEPDFKEVVVMVSLMQPCRA